MLDTITVPEQDRLPEHDHAAIEMERYVYRSIDEVKALPTYRPTIGCIIPAYNEQDTIKSVLRSLLKQTRVPDVIHVIVNNTTDKTFSIAAKFAGRHELRGKNGRPTQVTEVFVHDIGKNQDKKVGALNYGFTLVENCDLLLGVDGDTTLHRDAVERLEQEIVSDSRIGGISAVYSIDDRHIKGIVAPLLIAGQRAQFAAFNLQNMLRGRNMAVLGGQCSMFSVPVLHEVMNQNHQRAPWVNDSEVEDSLLSLQIKSAGFLTKISATSRADVGGMTTLRALDGQQVKWNYGAIDLMWPGQRGDTRGQPFHPNLRLRWLENFGMVINAFTRAMFLILLGASLSIHAFVFSPLWLIPPAVAVLLNLRIAMSMKNRNWRDIVFAGTGIPAEIYMWLRIGHFFRAWTKFLSRVQADNWADQAKAERGRGTAFLMPLITIVIVFIAIGITWFQLPILLQSSILWVGWPVLYVITILQTVFMVKRLFRRHHGYQA
jgi:cellulose synthase/poly-beta-1,6-N-acetylglucosamine synthase-like glycosyltransferase